MDYFIFSALINALIAGLLGFIVILKNRKELINKLFFGLSLSVIFWSISYWQWLSADNASSALFWIRLVSIGSLFIPIFYFHWIITFLSLNKQKELLIKFLYAIVFIILFFSFSDLFIKDIEPKLIFPFWPSAGIFYSFYLIFIYLGLIVYTLIILWSQYKISSGVTKSNIKYIIIGSLIGFGGGATNFFLWYDIPILPYGNVLVSIYPIVFVIASFRYGLFNIKVIVTELLVFAVWVFLLIRTFLAESLEDRIIDGSLFALVVFFGVLIIKSVLKEVSQKEKFKEFNQELEKLNIQLEKKTRYLTALQDFTADITKNFDFKALIQKIVDEIPIRLGYVAALLILATEDGKKAYLAAISSNKATRIGLRFLPKPVSEYYSWIDKEEDRNLVVDVIKTGSVKITDRLSDVLSPPVPKMAIDLIQKTIGFKSVVGVPIKSEDKTLGAIEVILNRSKEEISQDSIEIMQALASQVGIVLKNVSLYEQIKAVNEKLVEMDKMKAGMYSFVSHQIKAPMGIVKGFAQLISEGAYGKIPKKVKETVDNIKKSADRLIQLVEDFLDLRRIEEGRMDFRFADINIVDLIKSVVNELRLLAEQKKLELSFNIGTSDVHRTSDVQKIVVKADEQRMRQVIQNLIENAIKYTQKGFVKVELTIEKPITNNSITNNYILLKVSDSGMGMAKDVLPTIFDQFKRAQAARTIKGSGLGLSIAKQIVEAHKGEIWAESDGEGKGSRFCVKLKI